MNAQQVPRQNGTRPSRGETASRKPTPLKGILTRTLMPSSVVKYIVPARIRHRTKNDVVLVGEHTIELKELLPDGTLHSVAQKGDFGSGIRAASVIGDPGLDARIPPTTGIDSIIKQEASEETMKIPDGWREAPPQILVIALESRTLIFLFAYQNFSDQLDFAAYPRPLPLFGKDERKDDNQLGKHIAVDPRSRAIAIAGTKTWITLYRLKSLTQLKTELEHNGSIKVERFVRDGPLQEERHVPIKKKNGKDGTILKMDFLYPANGDTDHVILLVVASFEGRTLLLHYEWDNSQALPTDLTPRAEQSVHSEEQMPLLLIPLTTLTGFMLVFEKSYSIYKKASDRYEALKRNTILQQPPEEPGSSRRAPLWSQWTRPVRHAGFGSASEVIYLCREDGKVRYVQLEGQHSESTEAGKLEINVDSAFTCLDNMNKEVNGDLSISDILAVGGDMSNGGLYLSRPRHDAQKWQTIPCWAPIVDFVTAITSFQKNRANNNSSALRERIFAGTGKGPRHGAICELRYGIEALSGAKVDLNDLEIPFVTGLWVFPHAGETLLLLTDPTQSRLVVEGVQVVSEEFSGNGDGFDMNSTTVTAGSTTDGLVLQVTPSSIRLVLPLERRCHLRDYYEGTKIIEGAIHGTSSSIITAVRMDGEVYLHHEKLTTNREKTSLKRVGAPLLLSSEPTCVASHVLGSKVFVFIGTAAGTILLLQGSDHSGFVLLSEHTLEGDFAICDSFAVSHVSTGRIALLLLCGLRNGTIHICTLDIYEGSIVSRVYEAVADSSEGAHVLQTQEIVSIGDTTVKIASDTTYETGRGGDYLRAMIVCGEDSCRLEYQPNPKTNGTTRVNSIWLMDHQKPGFHQGAIRAMAQPENWNLRSMREHTTATFFCVERSVLHFVDFDTSQQPRVLPRRLYIGGTPSRIMYSKRLDKLIVAFTKTVVRAAQPHNQRLLYPVLKFIDPSDEETNPLEDDFTEPYPADHNFRSSEPITQKCLSHFRPHVIGSSGEKVLGIFEWYPEEDGKSYHLLVMNTTRARVEQGRKNTGRILLLELTQDQTGRGTFNFKPPIKNDSPIWAAAPYGKNSLVFCAGKSVVVQTLSIVDKKWKGIASMNLSSEGRALSTDEPFIYVTTMNHSLVVLRLDGDHLEICLNNTKAHDGLHHLLLSDQSLILQTDKQETITGLWQPPPPASNGYLEELFKARLPVPITRLVRAAIKPPWRTSFSTSDTVVGTSIDGAVYQFDLLDEAQWRLLRFLYNMIRRDKTLCPFDHNKEASRHIEPSTERAHHLHVDGDLLNRLLDREPAESEALLRGLLDRVPQSSERAIDFKDATTRRNRFFELLIAVIGVQQGQDLIAGAIEHLRKVLETAL